MKITGVETCTVAVPEPHRGGQEWYFLKINTDEGIYGWGEMAFLSAQRGTRGEGLLQGARAPGQVAAAS